MVLFEQIGWNPIPATRKALNMVEVIAGLVPARCVLFRFFFWFKPCLITNRIHVCYTWSHLPSIYPSHVSIYIYIAAPWILWVIVISMFGWSSRKWEIPTANLHPFWMIVQKDFTAGTSSNLRRFGKTRGLFLLATSAKGPQTTSSKDYTRKVSCETVSCFSDAIDIELGHQADATVQANSDATKGSPKDQTMSSWRYPLVI